MWLGRGDQGLELLGRVTKEKIVSFPVLCLSLELVQIPATGVPVGALGVPADCRVVPWSALPIPAWLWHFRGCTLACVSDRVRAGHSPQQWSLESWPARRCGRVPHCSAGWCTAPLLLHPASPGFMETPWLLLSLLCFICPSSCARQSAPSVLSGMPSFPWSSAEWQVGNSDYCLVWALLCFSDPLLWCCPGCSPGGTPACAGSMELLPFPSQSEMFLLTRSWQLASLCLVCLACPFPTLF